MNKHDIKYKKDVLKMLSKGLATEELVLVYTLNDLKTSIRSAHLDARAKKKLTKHMDHLLKDTIRHAVLFSSLIKKYEI